MAATTARLRHPVRLYQGAEGERHATWLELFFDLVMVVAVAQLGAVLHDDLSVRGVAVYFGLFVPVWAAWLRFAYYGDLFDTDDVAFRLVMLVAMANVGVLALTIRSAAEGATSGYALGIAVNTGLCCLLYVRGGRRPGCSRSSSTSRGDTSSGPWGPSGSSSASSSPTC